MPSFTNKKLVLFLAASKLVTDTKTVQKIRVIDQVLCICYPIKFQNNKNNNVFALFDFKNEAIVVTLAYVAQLGLKLQRTDFDAQKIDKSLLET